MSYLKILGFAVISLTAIMLFRRMKDEYAVFISLLSGIALTLTAISILGPVILEITDFCDTKKVAPYIPVILKSAGIAIITTVGTDLCRDAGEQSLGNKLELCGKALILSLSLPLIKNVLDNCFALLG